MAKTTGHFEALVEAAKFAVRVCLLIAIPQVIAIATQNQGVLWADALSAVLPVVDKWLHENDKIKLNGLLPF